MKKLSSSDQRTKVQLRATRSPGAIVCRRTKLIEESQMISMRGPSPEASGEASGSEGDDSSLGTAPTSGPEATSSQGIPPRIRATDLGEFLTDRDDYEDDILLCCIDPEADHGGAVQSGSCAMELMEEMARRYNAHDELLAALQATEVQLQRAARNFSALAEGWIPRPGTVARTAITHEHAADEAAAAARAAIAKAIGEVSTLCAVCDQIRELHPSTHPFTPKAAQP